ncbi:MAG: glycosyltransferase family 4 protein, partial [Veillonellaceae bacterium]|nr:glycosyltransferase family 4 protein [Veillonellaceae bacterium]
MLSWLRKTDSGEMMKKFSIIEMISISYEWGGIEQHVKDVASGLVRNGHKVTVVCRDFEMYKKAYSEVCPVKTLPIKSAIDPVTVCGLAKLLKETQADIIHTHTSRDSWLALFATWLAGRGKVVTTRHVPLIAKQDFIHTWYFNQLAGIICVSEFVKNKFFGTNPKINTSNVRVIYPGIKINENAKITRRLIKDKFNINDGTFLIGFVGRVTMEKGLDDLIEAVALLKEKVTNFRVVIVGGVNPKTPEYVNELKEKAKQLGVYEYVEFYGFCNDIPSVMHDIDCLVLPSIIPETFGLVLGEAML